MRVSCAFYGLANQAGKTELMIEREHLHVGERLVYRGDLYVLLSVFEEGGKFRANVALEKIQKVRESSRTTQRTERKDQIYALDREKTTTEVANTQERLLREQLFQTEIRLNQLLAEREELEERIEKLIQQLDHLQQ
jgi:hypothetical protein